jgi:hypothetical protein
MASAYLDFYSASSLNYQRLSRACIVHLVKKQPNWSYVKTMSCSGSHLGITINKKNTSFSVFYADRKSKMAATTGHSINTGSYGENTEIYSSLKLLHWLNWTFSHRVQCSSMSCGGGHLGLPIGIKNICRGPSNDHSWAVWYQLSKWFQILLKPSCTWMFIGWSSTNCTFFVPIWNSKWRLRQDLV